MHPGIKHSLCRKEPLPRPQLWFNHLQICSLYHKSKVLAETKQEAISYRKECEAKDKDLVNSRVEIDRLNKEVLILQKSNEMNPPKKKKQQHNTDDDSIQKELQSVKKDLDAARRANSKLEKELIDINKQKVPLS